jgi:hypothetical protein
VPANVPIAEEEEWDVKYVLLFVEPEQYARDLEAMDQADRDRAFMLVGQWFMENADKVRGGSKLQPPDTATTVRMDGGGDPVVVDGPFVEGKEVVSGYAEVEAENLDEVLAIVKTWPGCPVVEIRPLES